MEHPRLSQILKKLLPLVGLLVAVSAGCTNSVCETNNDCPVGNVCVSGGACAKGCTADTECPQGNICDLTSSLCKTGCRSSSDCANGQVCAHNLCFDVSSPAQSMDGGLDDGGALTCSCLQSPRGCLKDINPNSTTVGTLVCEPSTPARAALLFFGNVDCSHCQNIIANLLVIQSQLRGEGLDPLLVFVQLKTFTYSPDHVKATFPTHTGPVLQDTDSDDVWGAYGADWYQVKIIDSHGCLSAFFAPPDTEYLMSGGQLKAPGEQLKDAWRASMGSDCHALSDAAL
jgi:hypothetical protein